MYSRIKKYLLYCIFYPPEILGVWRYFAIQQIGYAMQRSDPLHGKLKSSGKTSSTVDHFHSTHLNNFFCLFGCFLLAKVHGAVVAICSSVQPSFSYPTLFLLKGTNLANMVPTDNYLILHHFIITGVCPFK